MPAGLRRVFCLTSLHLGNPPFVKDNAAHELNIEMALPDRTLGSFPHCRESFRKQLIQSFTAGQAPFELDGLGRQLLIR